jgi:hypothetical protein
MRDHFDLVVETHNAKARRLAAGASQHLRVKTMNRIYGLSPL